VNKTEKKGQPLDTEQKPRKREKTKRELDLLVYIFIWKWCGVDAFLFIRNWEEEK
jgi:hypothetical protein